MFWSQKVKKSKFFFSFGTEKARTWHSKRIAHTQTKQTIVKLAAASCIYTLSMLCLFDFAKSSDKTTVFTTFLIF
jgi:hypothetical protein